MAGSPSGGVEIGAGYVSIYPDTSSFHGALIDAIDSTGGEKAAKSFFAPWQIAVGNLLTDIARGLIGNVQERVANAIGRLDTLTNYPKVMEGFGYTAQEAEESIELIMDRLMGLPTRTQDMVQFTQSLADSTGDLDLATRSALAFNDALLASGASATDQTRAMRMWNRIVGSGTATVNQWSSLMAVMPLQLGMTSRAILGAEASTEDLGIALREGNVSIEEILRTMVRLDTEGAEGMDSFNKQAWNMAFTLDTALKLIPMRIENALAAIMKEIGRDVLIVPFLALANGIKDAGDTIVEGIHWVKMEYNDSLHQIAIIASGIGRELMGFFNAIAPLVVEALGAATPVILDFVKSALTALKDNLEVLGRVFSSISPGLMAVANALGGVFVSAFEVAGEVLDWMVRLYEYWANVIIENSPAINGFLASVADGIAMWTDMFSAAAPVILGFLETAFHGFIEFCGGFIDGVITTLHGIEEFVTGFIEGFGTIARGATDFSIAVTEALFWVSDFIMTFFGDCVLIFVSFGALLLETIGGIGQGIEALWDGLVKTVKDAWNDLKKNAKNLWNSIRKTITNIVEGIVGSVVGFFRNIANTASNIWNGMRSTASSIWNGIKSTIGGVVDGIRTAAGNAWDAMKSTASSAWNAMKSTAGSVFNNIKSTIGNALNGARSLAQSAISGIQGFINSLTGRTVDVKVNDGTPGGTASLIRKVQGQIDGLHGRTVTVNVAAQGVTRIVASAQGVVASFKAQYGYLATGGIVTAPTLAMIGEAGTPEGVIPLSPSGMKPIAQAVVAELDGQSKGGVLVTGNNFYVRDESDISRVANELNFLISRQNGGRL